MCCADILFSCGAMLQPWLLPPEGSAFPTAMGTFGTCSFNGLMSFGCSAVVAIYNCALSVSFLMIVVFNWNNEKGYRRVERPAHLFAWVWPLAIFIPAAATGSINPGETSMVCAIEKYPLGCSIEDGTCTRGEHYELFDLMFLGTVVIVSLAGFASTIWLYCSYRGHLRRNQQHEFSQELITVRKKKMETMTYQAILYSLVYLNTLMWPVLHIIIGILVPDDEFSSGFYALIAVSWWFYPLQGFFNYFVYARPQTNSWRKRRPEMSSFAILIKVFKGEAPSLSTLSRRFSNFSALSNGAFDISSRSRGKATSQDVSASMVSEDGGNDACTGRRVTMDGEVVPYSESTDRGEGDPPEPAV